MSAVTKKEEHNNLDMWSRLEKTDPKYTKPFKGKGGFSGTAVNGTYLLKRLTEEFGPCGIGWRFVLDSEEIVEGHTLKNGDRARLHKVLGHLEYRVGPSYTVAEIYSEKGWCRTSPQFGQTMLVDENKYGTFTDEEAPKKSITDCISKCCVLLGLVADVHLGMFDDNKYVNQRKAEVADAEGEQREVSSAPEHGHGPDKDPLATYKPTEDEVNLARATFSSIKLMVKNAVDLKDIDECLKANKAGLATLQKVSSVNYEGLKKTVQERRKELEASAPFVDDDLPEH